MYDEVSFGLEIADNMIVMRNLACYKLACRKMFIQLVFFVASIKIVRERIKQGSPKT